MKLEGGLEGLFLTQLYIREEMGVLLYLWGDALKDLFNILAIKGHA
jgi:hypothetical protein